MPQPYPFTSAIGRMVTGTDVERAALAVLRKWSSTYLAAAELATGRDVGSLPRVKSWTTTPSFDKWPEDQLPAVLLVSPGLAGTPQADGQGAYRARFSLGIAVIASTANMATTAEIAKLYCAAFRTCLVQHQSLEGFCAGVDWLDETYDDLPLEDTRSLGAAQAVFTVEVRALSLRWNGPPTPWFDPPPTDPDDPPPDGEVDPPEPPPNGTELPPDFQVETVRITTQPLPIQGE